MTIYNLDVHTLEFSKQIIGLCKKSPLNRTNDVIVRQLIRSGTSIGANYKDANKTNIKKVLRIRLELLKRS